MRHALNAGPAFGQNGPARAIRIHLMLCCEIKHHYLQRKVDPRMWRLTSQPRAGLQCQGQHLLNRLRQPDRPHRLIHGLQN